MRCFWYCGFRANMVMINNHNAAFHGGQQEGRMTYQPAVQDTQFILFNVLDAGSQLRPIERFADADGDLQRQVLEEAAKFVAEVVAPLNAVGDIPGCRFDAGEVTTPPGFAPAYQAFWQAGWPALSCAPEHGGQGLPWVLE